MSKFVISLDFELFWGVADGRTVSNYGGNVRGERQAIPRMLDLFTRYGIRATWATVGMVMCADYAQWRSLRPDIAPGYDRTACSPYLLDETVRAHPELFFARDLVKLVRDTDGQEVATHTYSHFYCDEPGATPQQFLSDMRCAKDIGAGLGLTLTSLVFPRNQILPAYVAVLSEAGVSAYRSNPDHALYRRGNAAPCGLAGRAVRLADSWLPLSGALTAHGTVGQDGVTALPASMFLRPYASALAPFEALRLHRIKAAMSDAAKAGGDFHLWWHPHNFGADTSRNLAVLEAVLQHYQALQQQYGMQTASMAECAAAA